MSLAIPTLHKDLSKFIRGVDYIFVDLGKQDTSIIRSAILASDIFIIPCLPSQIDFWALNDIIKILDESRIFKSNLKAYFLLNQMDLSTNIAKDALNAINTINPNISGLKSYIVNRVAYKRSIEHGKGVIEWNDPKAKQEMLNLYKEIII